MPAATVAFVPCRTRINETGQPIGAVTVKYQRPRRVRRRIFPPSSFIASWVGMGESAVERGSR